MWNIFKEYSSPHHKSGYRMIEETRIVSENYKMEQHFSCRISLLAKTLVSESKVDFAKRLISHLPVFASS